MSGASHEIDISLNRKYECMTVRSTVGGPYPGPPVLGLELKHYGSESTLNKNFARALLGVAIDLDPLFVTQSAWLKWQRYYRLKIRQPNWRQYGLVTTAGLSLETAAFLKTYAISDHSHFSPNKKHKVSTLIKLFNNAINSA